MNFSNLWKHPKTTIAGLLLGVVQAGTLLSGAGLTFGAIGTTTWVGLAVALATTLLGAFAKDPGSAVSAPNASTSNSTAKLGALMLISLTLLGTMPVVGCTQAQRVSVAQEIVNWTPVFISTADTVNAAIEALDPATVAILGPMTLAINTFGPEFEKAAQAYLANPSQTNLQVIQALIVQIQQDTNSALLAAAKITNPTSQATATKNVNLIATIANTLLALVQSISTKTQVAAMAGQVRVTFAQVRPYLDEPGMQRAADRVAGDLALSRAPTPSQFFAYEAQSGF